MKKLLIHTGLGIVIALLSFLGGVGWGATTPETPRPNTPKADIYLYTASGNLINHWEVIEVSFPSSADRIYFTDLEGVEHTAFGTYTVHYRD